MKVPGTQSQTFHHLWKKKPQKKTFSGGNLFSSDSSSELAHFWTSRGRLRGIWLHLWMTWIPKPLADAGCCGRKESSLTFVRLRCGWNNTTRLSISRETPPPHSGTDRLDDPLLPGALVPGLAQQLDVLGQDEGPRDEAELLLPEADLHLGHVPPQTVLPADLERSREVVQLWGGREKRQDAWRSE